MDNIPVINPETLPKKSHENCTICNSPNKTNIEKRYQDGWRVIDLANKYSLKYEEVQRHFRETGLERRYKRKRKISIDDFMDEVIRAGMPLLEGDVLTKGLYMRDVIDAAKVKLKIKDQRKIEELWDIVEKSQDDFQEKESEPDIKKTVHRLSKIIGQDEDKVDT